MYRGRGIEQAQPVSTHWRFWNFWGTRIPKTKNACRAHPRPLQAGGFCVW